jgi:diguanylate cyclase (GGDEF)-like protein/putative nucleotidyltransferase with HDIG domain
MARWYGFGVCAVGLGVLIAAGAWWHTDDWARYCHYALIVALTAGLKMDLASESEPPPAYFLFVLAGMIELGFSEVVTLSTLGAAFQGAQRTKGKQNRADRLVRLSIATIATAASFGVYASLIGSGTAANLAGALVCSSAAYFGATLLLWTIHDTLAGRHRFTEKWRESFQWSAPYYLVAAGGVAALGASSAYLGWQVSLLVLPAILGGFYLYRLYLDGLNAEKNHASEMAELHRRTIEALSRAIEAKDHATHDHLKRVEIYAVEIGKELELGEQELKALRAAAMLHDIGKLAVPENVLSKPGRLSPDEFDKMRIHPVVGEEIIKQVQFPYPVAPIVRSHHEHWDGSGYPDGLRQNEIPIGARILAVADCVDALSSDRHYRRAIPLEDAIQYVTDHAGVYYDPAVIEVLGRRYKDFEDLTRESRRKPLSRSAGTNTSLPVSPAAGFEVVESGASGGGHSMPFLTAIAEARMEAQMFYELTRDLGTSLSLDETLSVLTLRLKRLIPHDSAVFYVVRDDVLTPAFVNGDNFRIFSAMEIPMGEGLSGWVAANARPIINGNPAVEPGYEVDAESFSVLQSALAMPLEGLQGFDGVLTLYHRNPDAFTRDHLRVLRALTGKVALSIENALKFRQAESSATTDYLTGLPNARSLFLHLDAELARARRKKSPVAVLVCDLDGFKMVNDQFGHLEGNEVLRALAKRLREACREYDYVARMGGDEFVIVVPGFQPDALARKVETLRALAHGVRGHDFLSMSIGAACYPDDGDSAEQLLAGADRKMYANKNAAQDGPPPDERRAWEMLGPAALR